MCHRGACTAHTQPDPGGYREELGDREWKQTTQLVCRSCAEAWAADTAAIREACWCDGCGDVDLQYYGARTPKCAVCGKRFCYDHGQVLSYWRGNMVDCWIRCQDHAKSDLRDGPNVGWLKRRFLGTPDFAGLTPEELDAREFGPF